MNVQFIDTTFRDGAQSLWASGMRIGMMEEVAEQMDRAGFAVVEVPINGIYLKKFVRDLKEDPWTLARMVAKRMPNTVKACMAGGNLNPFGAPSPKAVARTFYRRLAEIGGLNRVQTFANTYGQMENEFLWTIPMYREFGYQVAIALSYTISPRHTDEYYAQKMREVQAFKPDVIYMEDQCGILTLDRVRTLIPAMLANAGGLPFELHAHCTTGLAPLVYLEALKLGVTTLHTAVPPLAEGPSQPSVFSMARNARLMGHSTALDEDALKEVEQRLTAIAKQDGLPIGTPLEYDASQYVHQMPGGVISNLRHQIAQLGIGGRLDEVLEESVRVRKDLGYPIMVTPHSQFVGTQAAINVLTGKRYQPVIDELILFAMGVYGEDSGHTWMDQNLKDRLLAMPRAKELEAVRSRHDPDTPLEELRAQCGGQGISDEEFVLRYVMKGEQELMAMHAAGPHRPYYSTGMPLLSLIRELERQNKVRYVSVRRGADSLMIHRSATARLQ